ncbi:MAG: DUF4124 domain-containing protein [Betaproteobacteria bacterium]
MKNNLFIMIGAIALMSAFTANAQVYQWKDANGRTIISDTPPPGNIKPQKSLGTSVPTVATATNANAPAAKGATPQSTAEKDMDFKKRQQEGKEKAEKQAKEDAAAAERKDNCDRAKQAQATLESGQRITTANAKGERAYMDDTQRQQELERVRKIAADACK